VWEKLISQEVKYWFPMAVVGETQRPQRERGSGDSEVCSGVPGTIQNAAREGKGLH
jgi:hypothetical protein